MSNTLRRTRHGLDRATGMVVLATLATVAWMRGESIREDRGSDSSEKSLMIILAIGIGTTVSIAAAAYIATKTALFK